MATKEDYKKSILSQLWVILSKDDDLAPEHVGTEGPEYEKWNDARVELVEEFTSRSGGG